MSSTAVLSTPSPRKRRKRAAVHDAASSIAPSRTWFGAGELIFAVFASGMLLRSRGSMLDDPGLGWHLRNIDAMLAAGGWLWRDPFTTPLADWPWRTNVWLGDLWLWLGWRFAGLEGIAVATAIVLALAFRLLYGMLVKDGVPWPVAAGWTFFGGLATSISWVARPTVFSMMFMLITAWTCDRYHRGKCTRRQTLWLLPMLAVWANMHGGFLAGLATIGIALAVEAALALGVPHGRDLAGARRKVKHFVVLLGGGLAATCLNPYGWTLHTWLLQLLGNDFFMGINQEWLSPDFHATGAMRYEALMLLLPLLLALSKRRPSLVALAISLCWLHAAWNGNRYIPLWVVVTVPLMARLSMDVPWLRERAAKLKLTPQLKQLWTGPPRASRPAATVIMILLLFGWARATTGFSYISEDRIATRALDDLIPRAPGKVVFHHYNWGGYLTWHGWPEVKIWIDDRNEVHGQAHIEEYFSIIEAQGSWREKLDGYNVALVCVPPQKPLAARLEEDAAWREVYRDECAVTFERR